MAPTTESSSKPAQPGWPAQYDTNRSRGHLPTHAPEQGFIVQRFDTAPTPPSQPPLPPPPPVPRPNGYPGHLQHMQPPNGHYHMPYQMPPMPGPPSVPRRPAVPYANLPPHIQKAIEVTTIPPHMRRPSAPATPATTKPKPKKRASRANKVSKPKPAKPKELKLRPQASRHLTPSLRAAIITLKVTDPSRTFKEIGEILSLPDDDDEDDDATQSEDAGVSNGNVTSDQSASTRIDLMNLPNGESPSPSSQLQAPTAQPQPPVPAKLSKSSTKSKSKPKPTFPNRKPIPRNTVAGIFKRACDRAGTDCDLYKLLAQTTRQSGSGRPKHPPAKKPAPRSKTAVAGSSVQAQSTPQQHQQQQVPQHDIQNPDLHAHNDDSVHVSDDNGWGPDVEAEIENVLEAGDRERGHAGMGLHMDELDMGEMEMGDEDDEHAPWGSSADEHDERDEREEHSDGGEGELPSIENRHRDDVEEEEEED